MLWRPDLVTGGVSALHRTDVLHVESGQLHVLGVVQGEHQRPLLSHHGAVRYDLSRRRRGPAPDIGHEVRWHLLRWIVDQTLLGRIRELSEPFVWRWRCRPIMLGKLLDLRQTEDTAIIHAACPHEWIALTREHFATRINQLDRIKPHPPSRRPAHRLAAPP